MERGIVGEPAEFMIDTRGAGQGGLGVTVEGPCEAAINCRDNGDGTCNVAYLPTEVGDYTVNITFNDEHITGSPFQAVIIPQPNLDKIKVSGLGIQPHGNFIVWLCHIGFDVVNLIKYYMGDFNLMPSNQNFIPLHVDFILLIKKSLHSIVK